MKGSSAKPHMKTSGGDRRFYWTVEILVALLALIVLYPLVLTLSSSFSSGKAVTTGRVFLFPVEFTLKGYEEVFKYQKVWIGYKNTFLYTFGGTFINVCMTLICAYPLSRREFPDRKFFTFLFTFSMLFSGGLIPTYLTIRSYGLLDNPLAVLVPASVSVYNMIIMRTYFSTQIPRELREAAQLDGCAEMRYLVRIVLPLSVPILAVVGLYYAVGVWNSYFDAMVYLSSRNKMPLTVFLREILILNDSADMTSSMDVESMITMQERQRVMKYSLIVVSSVPMFILYPFVQKYFVQGIMIGSVKG